MATSSEDAERSKPAPDIFRVALKKLATDGSEAVAIGDTPYDVEAAGKAGIRTIGMLSGGFTEADLRDAGCVAIYPVPCIARMLWRFTTFAFSTLKSRCFDRVYRTAPNRVSRFIFAVA